MSETLLIHYNIESPDEATWSLCNDNGELTAKLTTGPLAELNRFAATHPAVVLLNSRCLHLNRLRLPTQNMQKMLKAVPYAIEEFIAEDIENFHFVISKCHDDTTAVIGIDKVTLQNIIDNFQEVDINIEKIIPDALCLAADAGNRQWAVLNFRDYSYLQTDTLSGIIIAHDILPYAITRMLHDEKQQTPEKILMFSEQENPDAFSNVEVDKDDIELVKIAYNAHPLVIFCGQYKQALPLNLLQHEFKPRRKSSGYWYHWRVAASLAAVWLVLHLGFAGFQYSRLTEDNDARKAQIEKIYRQAFPQSRKIVNPRAQMEQKLEALKSNTGNSSNGLLFLLAESFGRLTHDKQNITLQSLTFRNNRMDIGLDSTNLQAIENLNRSLNSNSRIKSEIISSSSEKDRVRGNLRIEGKS